MNVLIDAHAFLWYFAADRRLSPVALTTIINSQNDLFVSVATLWEIAIKSSIGKLTLPDPFATFIPQKLQQANMRILEVKLAHLAAVCSLPFLHKDPFDRILAAQCQVEGLPVVSGDAIFDQYGIQRIW